MARVASAFRQGDITRAVKAMRAAGEEVSRVEIEANGKIVVFADRKSSPNYASDLDSELAEFEASHG